MNSETVSSVSAYQSSTSLAERLVGRVRNRVPSVESIDEDRRNVRRRTAPITGDRAVNRMNLELEWTSRRRSDWTNSWERDESIDLMETYRSNEEARGAVRAWLVNAWSSYKVLFSRELFVAWSDLETIMRMWINESAAQSVIEYRRESNFEQTSAVEGCSLVIRVYNHADIPPGHRVMIFNYKSTTIADQYLITHKDIIIQIHREIIQKFLPRYTYTKDTDIELIPMPAYINTAVMSEEMRVEAIEEGPQFLRLRTCIHQMDYCQGMDAQWDNFPGVGNSRFHRSFLVYLVNSTNNSDGTRLITKISRARLLYARGMSDRVTTMHREFKCYSPLPATLIISESSRILCFSKGGNIGQVSKWTHILSALDLRALGRVGRGVSTSYFRRDLYKEVIPFRSVQYLDPYQNSEDEDDETLSSSVALISTPVDRAIFGDDSD